MAGGVKVLLLTESPIGLCHLELYLERMGCHCWHAQTPEQALELFERHGFDLILSARPVLHTNALPVRLGNSNCSMFYRLSVEDGSWWLPLVDRGRDCLGTPALRSGQFLGALDRAIGGVDFTRH